MKIAVRPALFARRALFLSLLATAAILAGCQKPAPAPADRPDPAWGVPVRPVLDEALERRIDAMLERMPLEQKVGQIIQAEIQHVTPEDVHRYGLGSVLNGGGSFPDLDRHAAIEQWTALARAFHEAARQPMDEGLDAIPLLWGTDAVHGHSNVFGATVFPHNVGLGATRDAELVREIAAATAADVAATGIDWNFAPTVAVSRDARWGRAYESFSSDPELVTELGRAAVACRANPVRAGCRPSGCWPRPSISSATAAPSKASIRATPGSARPNWPQFTVGPTAPRSTPAYKPSWLRSRRGTGARCTAIATF